LSDIPQPPKKLYLKHKGRRGLNDIAKDTLGVVGSRDMSHYGKKIVDYLLPELLRAGICTVTGFARGIDTQVILNFCKVSEESSKGNSNAKCIAVIPGGIETVYPKSNEKLYERFIEAGGMIISEYPGTHPALKWTYARRNRIVAGLSEKLLVVEATENSGTFNTAEHSKEFEKEILTIPGDITSDSTAGVNILIKEGATPITSPKQILTKYGLKKSKKAEEDSWLEKKLNPDEKKIYKTLVESPKNNDQIKAVTKLKISEINMILSLMQLQGVIYKSEGFYYAN
jgi:DNA processing protein